MTWLWYKSLRRGEKAHAFRDGAPRSYCGLVAREQAGPEVDSSKSRCCRMCWNAQRAPGAPSEAAA
jgi:hypothetical protein